MRSSDYSASISNYFDSTNHDDTSDANILHSMFQLGAESNNCFTKPCRLRTAALEQRGFILLTPSTRTLKSDTRRLLHKGFASVFLKCRRAHRTFIHNAFCEQMQPACTVMVINERTKRKTPHHKIQDFILCFFENVIWLFTMRLFSIRLTQLIGGMHRGDAWLLIYAIDSVITQDAQAVF